MESFAATENLKRHPRNRSSFLGILSYLSFTWVLPILLKGRKNKLEIADLYQPLSDHRYDSMKHKVAIKSILKLFF